MTEHDGNKGCGDRKSAKKRNMKKESGMRMQCGKSFIKGRVQTEVSDDRMIAISIRR